MPRERKASVICFGLLRLSRGPRPSRGSTLRLGELDVEREAACPPLAHGLLELLPPREVELDAGELHLRYRGDRPELYHRDVTQPFLLQLPGEPLAQRQQDRGVPGGVLQLSLAESSRPVLAAGGLVHSLVQVALRHGFERVRGPYSPPSRSWAASIVSNNGESETPCSASRNW